MRSAAALLFTAVFFFVRNVAHAEWLANAEFSTVYETNINNAVAEKDRKSDIALIPAASFGYYAQLADPLSIAVYADLRYSGFSRFSGLDNLESGLAASVKYKWGLGSYSPWVKVFGSGAYIDYREDFRDEYLARTGLASGKRVSERFFAQIEYEYKSGSARDPRFDTRNDMVSAKIDYLLMESVRTWVGYGVGSGTYIATRPASASAPANSRTLIVNTFREPMASFQLDAHTRMLSFGAQKTLSNHWSADISADLIDIYGNERHYPDSIFKAGVACSY